MTHRITLAWDDYLEEDLNYPRKLEYYIIQLTYIVYGIMSALGGSGNLDIQDLIIRFGDREKENSFIEDMSQDEYTAMAVASWGARVGLDPRTLKKAVREILPPEKTLKLAGPGEERS